MKKMDSSLTSKLMITGMFLLLSGMISLEAQEIQMPVQPRHYVCYRASGPVSVDGRLDEKDWQQASWTEDFVDIEGALKPMPRFRTRVKMLWDEHYLYVAALMEEPHLWARLTERESVIFYDPDFEVFIDPDGDTHLYCELEVNALNTQWDLLITKPYRDDTIHNVALDHWNYNGLKTAVHLVGSLNDPRDLDTSWTFEAALPLDALAELGPGGKIPVDGQQYRINFSRVEWSVEVVDGQYQKKTRTINGKMVPLPEDNWVWSPQGVVNMHRPETWGYLQFSGMTVGRGTAAFVPGPDLKIQWALRELYYRQVEYKKLHQVYASDPAALKMNSITVDGKPFRPLIRTTASGYEATVPGTGGKSTWHLEQQGRIWQD